MIKNSIKIAFVFGLLISSISCSNEPLEGEFPDSLDPNLPSNPGSPTEPGEGSTGDYWPMAVGNTWVYNVESNNSSSENEYSVNSETTIEGLPAYQIDNFISDAGVETPDLPVEQDFDQPDNYVIKNEGNYYNLLESFSFEENGISLSISGFNYVFLKDYLEEGQSYSSDFDFTYTSSIDIEGFEDFEDIEFTQNFNYEMTMVERGMILEVNEVEYEDVIHIEIVLTISQEGLEETITDTSEVYLAKDIGPIRIINESEGSTSDLISYELN
ncbi:hypothetical protein [Psychroflexus aestuariivivens]|uniref:hypothetical protein n=1 Tax=Psychroflexus aestuariivivens TaxID=1795040 RepID=UPI000FDC6E1C|nr:hypothetical protein [Psychroflexus aestuariivivens]